MTTSVSAVRRRTQPSLLAIQQCVFETSIGWFGVQGGSQGISRLVFGFTSPLAVRTILRGDDSYDLEEADWCPKLREKLENYALGKSVTFDNVQVVRSRPLTAFQQRVVEIVRTIPRGQTLTYGEVAACAGSPGAARAVGTVMATNPVPIIIPCHRVVGSAGGLGGFSAAGGVRTKQWMLDLESLTSVR